MAEGIILAGGFSSRALSNKMVFDIGGKPLIWHTIQSIKPFVKRIIIVTGRYDQEIRKILANEKDIEIVFNKDFEKGMFSSVLAGVKTTTTDFFVLPGDCPFVSKGTFERLLNGTKLVRFPRCMGKDGHPLFISGSLKEKLLKESMDSNLKQFRNSQDFEIVEVDDKNIINDIDTIEDYQKLLKERNK